MICVPPTALILRAPVFLTAYDQPTFSVGAIFRKWQTKKDFLSLQQPPHPPPVLTFVPSRTITCKSPPFLGPGSARLWSPRRTHPPACPHYTAASQSLSLSLSCHSVGGAPGHGVLLSADLGQLRRQAPGGPESGRRNRPHTDRVEFGEVWWNIFR